MNCDNDFVTIVKWQMIKPKNKCQNKANNQSNSYLNECVTLKRGRYINNTKRTLYFRIYFFGMAVLENKNLHFRAQIKKTTTV